MAEQPGDALGNRLQAHHLRVVRPGQRLFLRSVAQHLAVLLGGGFLDLFGAWDPSLALVMGGAILVGLLAFTVAKKRTATFLGGALHLPTSNAIDKRLVVGGLLFALLIGAVMTSAVWFIGSNGWPG